MSETPIFQKMIFQSAKGVSLPYRLFLPASFPAAGPYPLIVFLHGVGERGTDNEAQLKNGIYSFFEHSPKELESSIVIAPQCPIEHKWVNVTTWDSKDFSWNDSTESVPLSCVADLIGTWKKTGFADADRVYCCGLSMGGFGTWDLLSRHPEVFAAGIPVCGGADPVTAPILKEIPIQTFHGLKDPTVPYTGTEKMVNAIRACGGDKIRYTTYPEGLHGIWNDAFATEGLGKWLLSQKRSDRK